MGSGSAGGGKGGTKWEGEGEKGAEEKEGWYMRRHSFEVTVTSLPHAPHPHNGLWTVFNIPIKMHEIH